MHAPCACALYVHACRIVFSILQTVVGIRRDGNYTYTQAKLRSAQFEVWAWGKNGGGQLGVGDFHDRHKPTRVGALDSMRVVQIAAGEEHTIALSCIGIVYTWGSNDSGQLGRTAKQIKPPPKVSALPADSTPQEQPSVPASHTPGIVQYFKNRGVVSVQAGERCSLLLGARNNGELSSIHVLAKEENENITVAREGGKDAKSASSTSGADSASDPESSKEQAAPSDSARDRTKMGSLVGIEHIGFVRSIACGGQMCGLLSQKSGKSTAKGMILRELASGELDYVNQLRCVIRHGLLPAYRSLDQDGGMSGVLKKLFESILNLLSEIWQMTCITAASFGEISNKGSIAQLISLMENLVPVKLYREYARCYADALANGVHKHPLFVRLVEEGVIKSNQPFFQAQNVEGSVLFHRLLRLPLERIANYELSFRRLGYLGSCKEENKELCAFADEWIQLTEALKIACIDANKTAQFWEENPAAQKKFATSQRRLVCHSRLPKQTLHTKGLLSAATWIILFNDIVGVSQVFSQREIPLNLLWIQHTDATDADSNRHSFQIVTPVEVLDVYTDSSECKEIWMAAFLRCICSLIKGYDKVQKLATLSTDPCDVLSFDVPMELTCEALQQRVVSYQLKDDATYGDATYHGLMNCGRVSGHGKILTQDGAVFVGNFEDGLCEGAAEMKSTKGRKGVCHAKGHWRKGKLHGRAVIKYIDGGEYTGDMVDGVRHGHGRFVSDMDDCYVGSWLSDVYHGYGVYEDGSKGSSYLGMWEDGLRHGPGTVVLPSGEFYAGNFVHNRMTGPGHLLTDDNSAYKGEFVGDCHLQGKGKLTLSNGDTICGMFNGHWSDKAGVKVNGVFQRNLDPQTAEDANAAMAVIYGGTSERELVDEEGGSIPTVDSQCKWVDVFQRGMEAIDSIRDTIFKRQHPYTTADYKRFLANAFRLSGHPLHTMLEDIATAFKTSYTKAGCHRRLLSSAVAEVWYIIEQVDRVVVALFPEMQDAIDTGEAYGYDGSVQNPATFRRSFVEPLVHAQVHDTLFALYHLTTKKLDAVYWNNVINLNAVPDTLLFKRFCVPRRLWLMSDAAEASERSVLCMDSFDGDFPSSVPGSGRVSPLLMGDFDLDQGGMLSNNTSLDAGEDPDPNSSAGSKPVPINGGPPRDRLLSTLSTSLGTSLGTSLSRSVSVISTSPQVGESGAFFDAIEAQAPSLQVGTNSTDLHNSTFANNGPQAEAKQATVDNVNDNSEASHDSPRSQASSQMTTPVGDRTDSLGAISPEGELTDSLLQGEALTGERYSDAIATIKQLAKEKGPAGKLKVLHMTFGKMANAVATYWQSEERLTSMDGVLPVFLSVLVRAQLTKLGADIRFLQDFLDMDDLSGESKILLTTLQASYCQLQLEET